jgi:hypothetical protein
MRTRYCATTKEQHSSTYRDNGTYLRNSEVTGIGHEMLSIPLLRVYTRAGSSARCSQRPLADAYHLLPQQAFVWFRGWGIAT